jgi:hypothetical protein
MAKLVKPGSQGEEILVVPNLVGSRDLVVVPGLANFTVGDIKGSDEDDGTTVEFRAEMFVGPLWRNLEDVSPQVSISGYRHDSPDTVDKVGHFVHECTWEFKTSPPPQRIKLIYRFSLWGGDDAIIDQLSYQLTAFGEMWPGQDFVGPGK